MGAIIVKRVSLDVNDLGAFIAFDVAAWDRLSIQMHDPIPLIGSGVVTLQVGVCDQIYNGFGSAITFTSTTSTHWQTAIDVENAATARLIVTTAKGSAGTVLFTVYGYNVED